MKELHSNMAPVQVLAAAAYTTTQTSTGLSKKGFNAVDYLISIGTITNIAQSPTPNWSFKMQESDDGVTYTDVTDANSLLTSSSKSPVTAPDSSTGVFLVVDAADEDGGVYSVGYCGSKEYSQIVATANGTPGSTPISIVAVKSRPNLAPTAH